MFAMHDCLSGMVEGDGWRGVLELKFADVAGVTTLGFGDTGHVDLDADERGRGRGLRQQFPGRRKGKAASSEIRILIVSGGRAVRAEEIATGHDGRHGGGRIPLLRSAAGAGHYNHVSSLATIVARPFVEHKFGAEQHANFQAAMLDYVETGELRGEPGVFEKAGLLREEMFVMNGQVAAFGNQESLVGKFSRSRDGARTEDRS
jgi:hypothetical protein